MTTNTKAILSIILIAFLLRMIGIMNPPLEKSHNWRQSFTAMVARNFEQTDILHPEVDYEGGKKVAMEFPIFSYLIFLVNNMFGSTDGTGRIINLIISSVGLFIFYRLISLLFDEKLALYSSALLCFSIFFSFSRKIMPDTFSVSLLIIGIYLLAVYVIKRHSALLLIAGSALISIGLLAKIPSLILLTLLIPILIDPRFKRKFKIIILIAMLPPLAFSYWWYCIEVPSQIASGASQLFFPLDFPHGLILFKEHLSGVAEKFYFSALSSYVSFALFLFGLVFLFMNKQRSLLVYFLLTTIVFFLFVLKSANFFYFHNYYIIPFVPSMAIVGGYGIKFIFEKSVKASYILLFAAMSEGLLNQQHDLFIPPDMRYKLQLENIVENYVPVQKKIILNAGPNPQEIYLCNRKGWSFDSGVVISRQLVDSISPSINPVVILDKHQQTNYKELDFNTIYQNENFIVMQTK